MAKKTAYLKKRFELRDGPSGLYPKSLLYKTGPEMEGFNGNFFFTYVTEPCSMHPVSGALIHPYDEILVFGSLDSEDMARLHGRLTIELGPEREVYTICEPSVVCIPAGLQHGPVRILEVARPFVHYAIGIENSGEYEALAVETPTEPGEGTGTRYTHLIKRLVTNLRNFGDDAQNGQEPEEEAASQAQDTGMGYEDLQDRTGILRGAYNIMGPGNAQQMVWLFGNDIENFKLNFSWGFYNTTGKWHLEGESHIHPEEEILIFVGMNPEEPLTLGCEIEMGMGWEGDRLILDSPGLFVCPKGMPHLPAITRWCNQYYGFIVANIDRGHLSPWLPCDEDGCILETEDRV